MKFASFAVSGRATCGAVIGDGLLDLGPGTASASRRCAPRSRRMRWPESRARSAAQRPNLAHVRRLVPADDPDAGKIICIGRNYGRTSPRAAASRPSSRACSFALRARRWGTSSRSACRRLSTDYDYEGELALVIGKAGRHIARERALDAHRRLHVLQRGVLPRLPVQAFAGRRQELRASGAFGPWMVTADEIPDPSKLELTTRLNGVQVQHASVEELIFDIPHLIAYLSGVTSLEPGRRHRHRHAGRCRLRAHAAVVAEGGRRGRGRDLAHRRAA